MADTIPNRRADFLDDDPFAELTRIMGHDPREPRAAEPAPQPQEVAAETNPEVDFNVDLESELLGDLDLSGFDQPSAGGDEPQPATDWRAYDEPAPHAERVDPAYAAPEVEPQPETYYPTYDEPAADHVEAAHNSYAEPAVAGYPHYEPAAAVSEPAFDEDFGSMLERELMGASEDMPAPQANFAEPAFEVAAVEPEVAVTFEAPEPEVLSEVADPDFDMSFLEDELARASVTADSGYLGDSKPEEYAAEAEASDVWHATVTPDPDATLAQDEIDLDLDLRMDDGFDASATEELASVEHLHPAQQVHHDSEPAPVEPAAWQPVAPAAAPPVEQPSQAAPQPRELSLEDELNALLSGEAPLQPTQKTVVETESWKPAVNTFGSANFAEESTAAPVSSWPRETNPEPAYEAPAAVAAEAPAEDSTDFADIFAEDFSLDLEEEPVAQPSRSEETTYSSASYSTSSYNDRYATERQPEVPSPQPVAAAAVIPGLAALSQWQPASARAAAHVEAPEVETVEVIENAPRAVDDLDIPEVDYAAPEQRPYDDLGDIEAEFAQAFGDFTPQETKQEPTGDPAAAPVDVSLDAYALGEGGWQPASQNAQANKFDYDADFDQAVAMAGFEDEAPVPPQTGPRRGLVIAAVVAGVALVAGAGAIGMSFLGGGSDGPAMVRADPEPMKVRPENPGGTTVPNQDSQAYQRVGGAQQDSTPGQERLISTAEEPVDVTAQAEPPALAPGIDDDTPAELASDDTPAVDTAKSEERLEPAQSNAGAPEEVAAVAPRRVRTMIVRPDGTLVPREDPAPSAAPAAQQQPQAVAPGAQAPALPQPDVAGDDVAALAEAEDSAPTVDIPATVGVVPSRRVDPQATAQAPAPVQQPAPQQQAAVQPPAATPVSAPAAAAPAGAASEWSMQIASQPTAEGAQATYQDLARRYGGVLQGRGVNIVRADIEGMGTYYRVRIPASSRDEAIQLCSRYKAAGGSCFVSR